jgi:hypothetical protein
LKVLYIDQFVPRTTIGGGMPRAYDNIVLLAELGYQMTVVGLEEHGSKLPPEHESRVYLQQQSIEVLTIEDMLANRDPGADCLTVDLRPDYTQCRAVELLLEQRLSTTPS